VDGGPFFMLVWRELIDGFVYEREMVLFPDKNGI